MSDDIDVVDNDVDSGDNNVADYTPTASEQEAEQFGWVPKEKFKGDPDQWRSADEFLQRGKEINGFLRKENEKVIAQIKARDADIAELKEAIKDFAAFHKETETRAYKRALDDLKAQKIEAIEQGDGSRVVEIDSQIDDIKEAQKTKEEPKKKTQSADDQAYFEWAASNAWYGTNEKLSVIADGVAEKIKKSEAGSKLVGKAFLDEVTRKVKELEPEAFGNPARNTSAVSSSSDGRSAPSSKGKKSYNDLPPEAKAACDKFVRQKLISKEDYVRDYFQGE